jgi:hypothetical protein
MEQLSLQELNLKNDLWFSKPVKILETTEQVTRTQSVKICKVQWKHYSEEEHTWERVI